ncbi:hypothetical protein [uncultured Draconibacterium sp.]|uniref:hypothetical protein n=1 Tax=uncultured Draconibacterium sp. TaxID=1573823 RepID=UPI0025E6F0FE|nr:hypothetical protein [uncultured Draconibacterium sp.]
MHKHRTLPKANAFRNKVLVNYHKWDFLIFTLPTILSVLNGQTTVFYLIYFFWWNELLCLLIDKLFYKKNPGVILSNPNNTGVFQSFIQMGVYFVFIVVFFGFMANWNNTVLLMINMNILFFQNLFFNINLIFVAAERIFLHHTQMPLKVSFGSFTPNMIVLHISIILGAVLMFFVVRNFPDTFTPTNLWGSVIIVLPFLLIKLLLAYLYQPIKNS